jgi:hypothetical protein
MSVYDDIVTKFTGVAPNQNAAPTATGADPYASVVANYQVQQHQTQVKASMDKTQAAAEQAAPTGFWDTLGFYAKNLPSAVGSVVKEAVTHPIKTASSIIGGLADVGPAAFNTTADIQDAITHFFVGKTFTTQRLPLPGQTFNDYIGNTSDVQKAISEGAKQFASYEIGGAAVKAVPFAAGVAGTLEGGGTVAQAGAQGAEAASSLTRASLLQKMAVSAGGNVIGGQLVTDAQTPQDRLKQAAFDAAFGIATEGGGAALGKAKGLIQGSPDVSAPEAAPPGAPIQETQPSPQNPNPQVIYRPKDNLGVDQSGQKVLARTQVDAKTGNAIVYYDRSLTKNPELRQTVIDHELGHVFDKRINNGTNLSAELPNYTGNKANLDVVLGPLSKDLGKPTEEVTQELAQDIHALSGGKGNAAENFADAVAEYRKNPEGAKNIAPTFAALMESKPTAPRISEHVTVPSDIPAVQNSPEFKASQPVTTDLPKSSVQPPQETLQTSVPAANASTEVRVPTKITRTPSQLAQTGLDTGKRVEAPSFNPKSINAPQDVENLMSNLAESNKDFSSQRISKGNEDIKDLARLTGLTEDQLVKAKPGSIANSETVTAARQLVLDKAQDLMNFLKGVDSAHATPEELQGVKERYLKLVAMQKSVAGFRTEASNVFRSLGIEVQPGENATLHDLADRLKEIGVASENDPSLFAGKLAQPLSPTQKLFQGALSTWYAAILSGPKTTVRNILSTGTNILTELATKVANPAQWNEVVPSISGLLKGLQEGFGEAKDVLTGEQTTGKFAQTGQAVKPEVFTGKFATYGKVVESVGRFLNAQDRFLSSGAREMERASVAASKPEVSQAISDAISKSYAEATVYHGLPRGRVISSLRDAAQKLRASLPESKIVVPFVDTVANVLDRQFDYLPVASALRLSSATLEKQADRIIKDFTLGADSRPVIIQRLRDQQIGRLWLGTLVSGGAIALAATGKVSGNGPTNLNEKAQLQDSGWRPNSIKIGDTWIPYTFLGPLAGILSMVGNIYDKTHYDQAPNKTIYDLMGKGMVGWTQTQLSQSFLSGVANVFDVISGNTDPKKYFDNFASGLVPIPAAYSQTKDLVLRQQFETRGIVDQLRQKLGLTGNVFGLDPLQPKLNAFGEPLTSDAIFGVTPSKETGDKVDNFLISNDIVVTKPPIGQQYSIPGSKQKRALTPDEYTRYIQDSGQEIYMQLNERMGGIANMRDEDKKKAVESLVDGIRTRVRDQIMR